jgi:hypothetical protein
VQGSPIPAEGITDAAQPQLKGITPNSFDYVFEQIALDKDPSKGISCLHYVPGVFTMKKCGTQGSTKLAARSSSWKENIDKGVYVKDLVQSTLQCMME